MKGLGGGTLMMALGALWFLFAAAFAVILVEYLAEGAGLQLLGWSLFPGGILIGVVHVLGFSIAATICFCIGVGLCAYGSAQRSAS